MSPINVATLVVALFLSPAAFAQDAAQAATTPAAAETAPATEPVAPANPASEPAPAAEASSDAPKSALIPAPEAGKGQLVFFREWKFAGGAIAYKIREKDAVISKLGNGTYIVINVEPGTHEYSMQGETKDLLTLDVEEGETYYVRGGVSMGILAGRPNLSPSDQATFEALAPKLKKR